MKTFFPKRRKKKTAAYAMETQRQQYTTKTQAITLQPGISIILKIR